MKTTVEISDELYRKAKAEAALRGRKLKDLVAEGLRLVLETPRETPGRRSLAALMKSARGTVDSGVSDLATECRPSRWFRPRCAPRSLIWGRWSLFSIERNRTIAG